MILRVIAAGSGVLFLLASAYIATGIFMGFDIISPSFSPDSEYRLAVVAVVTCVSGIGLLSIAAMRPPAEA